MCRVNAAIRQAGVLINPGCITEDAIYMGIEFMMALRNVITDRWSMAWGHILVIALETQFQQLGYTMAGCETLDKVSVGQLWQLALMEFLHWLRCSYFGVFEC